MMTEQYDYSLKGHNTFGIEARCRRFVEYASVEEAQAVAALLRQSPEEPFLIIGGGSNLLLTKDFPGVVVRSAIKGYTFDADGDSADGDSADDDRDSIRMTCGSGEVFDDMVAASIDAGYYGMENLSLIPGDVGASAVQNIGAYGVEVKDLITTVEAVEIATGAVLTFTNADCQYAYRQSRFKNDWKNRFLITHVTYALSRTFTPRLDYGNIRAELDRRAITEPTARQLRQTVIDIRNAKLPDPKVTGNGGSFFMNPVVSRSTYEELASRYPDMPHYYIDGDHEKIPAGWLIDQCGWKGRSLGRAGVHDKQALVLVNLGGATGDEIVRLCEAIRQDVQSKFGITIHPEVNIV